MQTWIVGTATRGVLSMVNMLAQFEVPQLKLNDPGRDTCATPTGTGTSTPDTLDACANTGDAISRFFGTDAGGLITAIARIIAIVAIIAAVVMAGWSVISQGGQGGQGGGIGRHLKGMLVPLVIGALLFQLPWTVGLVSYVASGLWTIVSSAIQLLPGVG